MQKCSEYLRENADIFSGVSPLCFRRRTFITNFFNRPLSHRKKSVVMPAETACPAAVPVIKLTPTPAGRVLNVIRISFAPSTLIGNLLCCHANTDNCHQHFLLGPL